MNLAIEGCEGTCHLSKLLFSSKPCLTFIPNYYVWEADTRWPLSGALAHLAQVP